MYISAAGSMEKIKLLMVSRISLFCCSAVLLTRCLEIMSSDFLDSIMDNWRSENHNDLSAATIGNSTRKRFWRKLYILLSLHFSKSCFEISHLPRLGCKRMSYMVRWSGNLRDHIWSIVISYVLLSLLHIVVISCDSIRLPLHGPHFPRVRNFVVPLMLRTKGDTVH